MKLVIKLLLLILVFGVSGLFILKRPDGNPWLSVEAFGLDIAMAGKEIERVTRVFAQQDKTTQSRNDGKSQSIKVYKWRDPDGSWKYSDKPPADRDELVVETMMINSNTNVVPARKLSETAEKKPSNPVGLEQDKVPLPLSVSPSQIKDLAEEAKKVQQLSHQRDESLYEY